MRFYKIILFCLAAFLVVAGCTVAFDAEQEDIFPCVGDDECVDGYVCDEGTSLCVLKPTGPEGPADCIDEDGDGYGVGTDRSQCRYPELDCDDTDPNVHPNNTESCNGVDSNCNGKIDSFECPGGAAIECGPAPVGAGIMKFVCVSEECILVPSRQGIGECPRISATCDSDKKAFTYDSGGQTHELVEDEEGDLQGEIAQQCG